VIWPAGKKTFRPGGDHSREDRLTIGVEEPGLRVEDRRFVAGAGRYVADVEVDGCLDAAFVRAEAAHGAVRRIDVAPAREFDGVIGAWAAADLPGLPDVPASEGRPDRVWPSLATGAVRYAGEPVAVVLAEDRYRAEDGAGAVLVEIDSLPAVVDPTLAAASAIELFAGRSNVVSTRSLGNGVPAGLWGDAHTVVEGSYSSQLMAANPMEARAILAAPDPEGGLTVWCSHQAAHRLRALLAAALELDEESLRVIVPDVGGAFGSKSQIYPEYVVVAHLARQLGRPVRWIEDRREALVAASTSRGQNQRVRMAADANGTILAIEAELDVAVGAYPHIGEGIGVNTAQMICGAYAIPHAAVTLRAISTTNAPTTAYRGAGRPEAAFAVERTIDRLARTLRVDPAELRRANFVRKFPYTTATGWVYDSGDYARTLDRALELSGYDEMRAEQRRRRSTPGSHALGIGICFYVERSGGDVGSTEFGSVEACADGSFVARSGSCSSGQAHETTFGALVASALGVDPGRVRVVEGDTASVASGEGTYGSRSLQIGGSVLHRAALGLVEEARARAAASWGVPAGDVAYAAGALRTATDEISVAEIAGREPLVSVGSFASPQSFPYGCYIAVVEIEPELGGIEILRLVGVDDVGVVLNPAMVEGQVRGSIVQGIGQALYEEVVHDEAGTPVSQSLLDYLLPTISELPNEVILDRTESPNPNTPLGTKGAGEVGCIGVPPAVFNAVVDALELEDESGLRMPLTPETVWKAIQWKATQSGSRQRNPRPEHGDRDETKERE
jgi:carbon-monoxide dehydrogenase large subunit